MAGVNLLDVPDDVLSRVIALPDAGQPLLGVCRRLRALCHAGATSITLTRSYEGAADDGHVAILARCPRLRRVDASALDEEDLHMPWPLAGATQLTSLTVWWFWGARNMPPTLSQLCIKGDFDLRFGQGQRMLSLMRSMRDTRCTVLLDSLEWGRYEPQTLMLAWMRGRVFATTLTSNPNRANSPRSALFSPGEPLSLVKVVNLAAIWPDQLTDNFTAVPTSLTSLSLGMCGSRAETLWELNVAGLSNLAHLKVSAWRQLTTLSHLTGLASLRALELGELDALVSFGLPPPGLPRLESLTLKQMRALTSLDWGVADQGRLRQLTLEEVPRLNVARELAPLTGLESIDISGVGGGFPASAAQLLVSVRFEGEVPPAAVCQQMTSVRSLSICESALADLGHFGALHHLTGLRLFNCDRLTSLDGLGLAQRLADVDIEQCRALSSIAALRKADCLSRLGLGSCEVLPHLQGVEECVSAGSSAADAWPQEGRDGAPTDICSLSRLDLGTSSDASRTASQPRRGSLVRLSLDGFNFSDLAFSAGASTLTELELFDLRCLSSLHGLEAATGLRRISFETCSQLTSLALLGSLPMLTQLYLWDCHGLNDLHGASSVASLTLGKSSIESFQSLAAFPVLRYLKCNQCSLLTSLNGIDGLLQLTSLELFICESITSLAGISGAPHLCALRVDDCKALESFGSQRDLECVRRIDFYKYECSALPRLRSYRNDARDDA